MCVFVCLHVIREKETKTETGGKKKGRKEEGRENNSLHEKLKRCYKSETLIFGDRRELNYTNSVIFLDLHQRSLELALSSRGIF